MNIKANREPGTVLKQTSLRRRLMPVLVASCFTSAIANPLGPQVINGQASFLHQGSLLSVTNTPGAIINWQSFSINPGEITRFIQQNPDSAVLNRIIGQDPSKILGALQSNGRVFLINPNGILFGQGAQVDVNGLVASTLNISNEDFLNGKMLFKAGDKAGNLKNEGAISTPAGGQVFLIAPNVENSGIITSPKGDVMLAAGHTVQLVDSLNPDLRVVLSAPENEALNLGQVITQGGRTGIYGALVKQRGAINADSAVVGENGKVVLKASRDALLEAGSRTTAKGTGKGGEIQVLGERVALTGDAKIDASGQMGGGTVLVGGDYQGKNPAVLNAKRAYLGKDAEINANAIDSGDGGKVIVWADEDTRAYGSISARGGATAGDGGFVEVSGKRTLDFHAKVDTSAPQGQLGTLLLDPTDINIVSGVAFGGSAGSLAASDANSAGTGDFIWLDTEDTGTRNIGTTDIATLLNSNNLDLQASNNINWASAADLNYGGPARTLTLKAGNNISLQSAITSSNPLNVSFLADGGISLNGASINANAGQVKLLAGSSVSFNTSAVESAAGTVSLVGGWDGNSASPAATGLGGVNLTDSHVSASTVILKAGTAGITTSGTGSHLPNNTFLSGYVGLDSIGTINVSSLDGDVVARTTGAGSSITLQDPGALIVGNSPVGTIPAGVSTNNGNIALTASAGMLDVNGAISAGTGAITLNGNAASYGVTVDAAISGGSAVINGNTSGIAINSAITVPGTLSLVSPGGTISQTVAVSAPGGIKAVGGTVTLNQANTTGIIAGSSSAGAFEFETNQTLSVQTVLGTAGINAGANEVRLKSTHTGGINQDNTGDIAGGGLGLISSGPVYLTNPGNSFTKLVANLTGGTGSLNAFSSVALDISGPITVDGTAVSNITTNNKDVELGSSVGLTVSDTINAGTGEVSFMSDSLSLGNTTTAGMAVIRPYTPGKTITVGSATCNVLGCLAITNLHRIAAQTIGIGGDDAPLPGSIHVAGIAGVGTGVDNRNAVTTRIGLLTAGGVTQSGVINVQDLGIKAGNSSNAVTLGMANSVTNLAVETSGAPVTFSNATTLTLADIEGGDPLNNSDYGVFGISTNGGAVNLSTVTGDLNIGSDGILSGNGAVTLTATSGNIKIDPLTVAEIDSGTGNVSMTASGNITIGGMIASGPTGNVSLTSTGGNIAIDDDIDAGTSGIVTLSASGAITNGGGTISGSALNASASGGINLLTEVGTLSALNSGANSDITISNSKAATLLDVKQTTPGSTGSINITNYGTLTVNSDYTVRAEKGDINLLAYHALNVAGGVSTTGAAAGEGDIMLFAYPTNTAAGADTLTITAPVTAVAGNITLKAGDSIVGEALATTSTGVKTVTPNMNVVPVTAPPPPPTLTECMTNPTLSGCSSVLPTLETCTTAPATTGCSAVLPTVDSCVTNPTKPGCSAVLPTVDACTANPTQAGCTAVLPSLDACTIAPSTPGCSVVLPTLATCTTAPTTAGCSAVLPSVGTCATAPTTPGCATVLPTLSTCLSAPATAGCTAVLPTIDVCTANPTQSGCAVVLPTLDSCTINPAQAGCAVVLPPLSTCTTAPATAGCSAVLPTVDACSVNPTQTGCNIVLPTLTSCASNPTQAGCTVVLPSLSACTSTPTLTGCSAVLPTLTQCSTDPSKEGCSVVVPAASKCVTNPSLPECQTVLPVTGTGSSQTPMNTISETVMSTTNIVLTTTAQASSNQVQSGGGSSSGGTTSKPAEKTSEKSDGKKEEKKTTSPTDDSGAKKNEPAKKMYCN